MSVELTRKKCEACVSLVETGRRERLVAEYGEGDKQFHFPSGPDKKVYGGAGKLNTEVSSAASAHATGFPGSPPSLMKLACSRPPPVAAHCCSLVSLLSSSG